MKKIIKHFILFYPLCFMLLSFSACGQGAPSGGGGEATSLPVTLSFRLPEESTAHSKVVSAPSIVDSFEIVVTGEGISEIPTRFSVSPGEFVNKKMDILLGPARIISITAFDRAGSARFSGESQAFDVVLSETPLVVTILLRTLNAPSELPRFSSNYILIDIVGTTPFMGKAESSNYTISSGLPKLLKPANIDTAAN